MENDLLLALIEKEVPDFVSLLVEGENLLNKDVALMRSEPVKERVRVNMGHEQ